jgi:hypothetical protein
LPEQANEATEAKAKKKNSRPRTWQWRPWLRATHRDFGYLVVGLTFVYAVSGVAVNHIDDWNSNFEEYERTHQIGGPLPDDDKEAAKVVRDKLGIAEEPSDIYRADDNELELQFDERTLVVQLDSGAILDTGRTPRFFLRVANWLHLNRHKKAWTYFADAYAALLLFLAFSGMFMIKGRKGFWGRGAILVAIGSAVPILYVTLSGGP